MDNCKRIDELALKFKDNFEFGNHNGFIKDSYKKKVFWELSQLHISSVDVSFSVYDNTLQECDYEIKMEEGFNQPIDVSSSIFGLFLALSWSIFTPRNSALLCTRNTFSANLVRYIASCKAEFPPPTTATFRFLKKASSCWLFLFIA